MTKKTVAKSRARTKPRTKRAENKPRARSADGRAEGPVDSEIRRAAKRAGISRVTPDDDPRDLPGFDVLAALVGVSFEVNDALDASIDALRPDGPAEANAETVRAIVHLRRAKQRITRTTNELGKMAREQGGAS